MNLKTFKKDLSKKPHCILLYEKKAMVAVIYPEYVDELCPIETEMVQNGVYLIMSGGMHTIADNYRVEW